jgi:hypothetical protein
MSDGPVVPPLGPGALEGHEVRVVPAHRAAKDYLCPECSGSIRTGVGHVVAWPEGRAEERRHWHRACWRVVSRRGRVG